VRIKSLRTRLTAWYLAILATSLILFSILLHQSLSQSLYRHHDDELAADAQRLSQGLRGADLDRVTTLPGFDVAPMTDLLAIVRDPQGDMLYRSPLLEALEPDIGRHEALVHAAAQGGTAPLFFTVDLQRSGPVRFICVPIDSPARGYLQIGRPLGDVPDTLRAVATACTLLVPVILVVMSFSGWIVASRALAPVKAIDETLQSIQVTELSRRIGVPVDAELAPLVATLNRLLDRLEKAFSSQKQFTADVSHQLQTPLTVMKGTTELSLASARGPTEYRRTLEELGDEIDEMARVLVDLRALALADTGVDGERVNLTEVTAEAAEIIEALAEPKGVLIDIAVQPDVTVWGSRSGLKQVVLNLADNAVKYTSAGGRVAISLASHEREARISVSDTGAGIPPEDLPRVFDRFFRGSGAPQATGGTGLGLAIAKRIVEAHGGTIQVESRPGHGSTFRVMLPLAHD